MAVKYVITAEHGGNRVPVEFQPQFCNAAGILETHRGWDPGSLDLAKRFARRLKAPIIKSTVTRLLADLNRSPGNHSVFSEFTRPLDRRTKQAILDQYHSPHRQLVQSTAEELIEAGHRVIHIGMHSFTPELHGRMRLADVGFLYDPRRAHESSLCLGWQKSLQATRPDLKVRRNYPYRGTTDGLTTSLRRILPAESYIGIEVEVNQLWPLKYSAQWPALQTSLLDSFLSSVPAA